jgi:hypothetical protein
MLRLLLALGLFISSLAFSQQTSPEIIDIAEPRIVDVDLRDLPKPAPWKPGDPIREVPRQQSTVPVTPAEHVKNPDLRAAEQALARFRNMMENFADPDLNLDGQDFAGANPADPVGAVGPNFYIQAVNYRSEGDNTTSYVVYDKLTGAVEAGPFLLESLGSGNCASGFGDPIIIYDQLAGRWILSEFSELSLQTLCVYVSRTADPITGGWFAYSFEAPKLPDFPKYGLHPSAILVSSQDDPPALWALDRQSMLAGQNATFVRFTIDTLPGFGFHAVTPADLDGDTAPDSAQPGYFLRHNDDEIHTNNPNPSTDFLELYALDSGFGGGPSANLTGPIFIPVSEFDSALCPATPLNCIPQPGTTTLLDTVREVVMHRLVYRIFDSHEALVGSFTVDADGNDLAGIRWFELRKAIGAPADTWSLYQEGTFTLKDGVHRWMPSIAMDQSGNIAMGYRASSTSEGVSLRYVGRRATDPLGVMTEGEHVLVTSQGVSTIARTGDYSALTIDPVGDCTFYFTSEYYPSANWRTRIAAFSFDDCGCERPATPGNLLAEATPDQDFSVSLTWEAVPSASTYAVYRAQANCGEDILDLVAENLTDTSFVDTLPSGSVPYSYQVRAFSSTGCASFISTCQTVTPTGPCLLAPEFNASTQAVSLTDGGCGIQLSWDAASSACAGDEQIRYNIFRSTQEGFVPSADNLLVGCYEGVSFLDTLVIQGTSYYYQIQAEDISGSGAGSCSGGILDGNQIVVTATVGGAIEVQFSEDFELSDANFLFEGLAYDQSQRGWGRNTLDSVSGAISIFVSFSERETDQVFFFATPELIAENSQLTFQHRFNTETGVDGGVLEYSIDGTTWQDILAGSGMITANPQRFESSGYNLTMDGNSGTPLAGREAWSGQQGWSEVRVDLADFVGETINFRWRAVGNAITASEGWRIDDIVIQRTEPCAPACNANDYYADWQTNFVPDIRFIINCVNTPKM